MARRSSGSPSAPLWARSDGKGFNLQLDYLPLNGAQTVVRAIDEDAEAGDEGGAQ